MTLRAVSSGSKISGPSDANGIERKIDKILSDLQLIGVCMLVLVGFAFVGVFVYVGRCILEIMGLI